MMLARCPYQLACPPLDPLHPVRLHCTLAFHHQLVLRVGHPWHDHELCLALSQQPIRDFGDLQRQGLGRALHPRGRVHCVPKEAIPRHGGPHDPGNHRARGDPGADLQFQVASVVLDEVDGLEGKADDALSRVGPCPAIRSAAHDHVGVADCLYLVHTVLGDEGVELAVELVEHRHDLQRVHVVCHVGKAHDVGEEDGDCAEDLYHLPPMLQPLDGPGRHDAIEQLFLHLATDKDRQHEHRKAE
mmetsp:Transcript_13195/g.30335  ORF Transcript_13195/g.30335 Transcript_13195/m.30335 type:complete len:244 (+) Transcript_13195:216-947(+)